MRFLVALQIVSGWGTILVGIWTLIISTKIATDDIRRELVAIRALLLIVIGLSFIKGSL